MRDRSDIACIVPMTEPREARPIPPAVILVVGACVVWTMWHWWDLVALMTVSVVTTAFALSFLVTAWPGIRKLRFWSDVEDGVLRFAAPAVCLIAALIVISLIEKVLEEWGEAEKGDPTADHGASAGEILEGET